MKEKQPFSSDFLLSSSRFPLVTLHRTRAPSLAVSLPLLLCHLGGRPSYLLEKGKPTTKNCRLAT
jgi:hypothetical protein